MAKEKQATVQPAQSPKPQGSETQKDSKNGILFGLIAFLTALVIMLAVFGGAFYVVVHNNVNGIGEKYRNQLQKIPVLKLALPAVPDPEDPKYLTDSDIRARYAEMKKQKDDLTRQLSDTNKKIAELQKYKDSQDSANAENTKNQNDINAQKAQLDAQKKQLEEDRKKLNEMIASGDKAGFKDYFEKVDKDTAQKIYTQIMQEQKASDDAVKFAKLYESMDPAAAAAIFEQMGTAKLDTVVEILKNMKKDASAEVIAAMTPSFGATVTDKLSKTYLGSSTVKSSTGKTTNP